MNAQPPADQLETEIEQELARRLKVASAENTSLEHGLVLVPHNTKDFQDIPESVCYQL